MSERFVAETLNQQASNQPVGWTGSPSQRRLTLAVSASWDTFPQRFSWIEQEGLALEYTPDPEGMHQLREHTLRFIEAGIPLRYHGLFPQYEIAHADAVLSERAMQKHFSLLEAMQGWGNQVVTFHVCHSSKNHADHSDPGKVVDNLSRLVARAGELGITVCLENLARGPSSYPENIAGWSRDSGAMITLDIGHVLASHSVRQGEISPLEFVELTADRVIEAHIYGGETDHHHPITDMGPLRSILDRLLETACSWWTIELDKQEEVLTTRRLLLDYLNSRGVHVQP